MTLKASSPSRSALFRSGEKALGETNSALGKKLPSKTKMTEKTFPQPAISDKRWTKELEKDVYEHWKQTEVYKFDAASSNKKPV